jgi:hypothetical protein
MGQEKWRRSVITMAMMTREKKREVRKTCGWRRKLVSVVSRAKMRGMGAILCVRSLRYNYLRYFPGPEAWFLTLSTWKD